MTHHLKPLAAVCVAVMLTTALTPVFAQDQPAPIPRLVIPQDQVPETAIEQFSSLANGESVVEMPGGSWLQVVFESFDLGSGSITITGADDQMQNFNQESLTEWGGRSAIFNGDKIAIVMEGGASATIAEVVVGLPNPTDQESAGQSIPETLRSFLGDGLNQFIPTDIPSQAIENDAAPETICGTADNRTSSTHAMVGRIMPVGCTGWLIEGGQVLTAGHCTGAMDTLEFNVPSSTANGGTVSPPIQHQYAVIDSSLVQQTGGPSVGNDWAMFRVATNTQTGLTAHQAQGAGFSLSNSLNPATVRITGHGVDGPPPQFGRFSNSPKNADNQTQQTHLGTLTQNSSSGAASGIIRYAVDTMGGNSGSPVIAVGTTDVAIGIHTNGGCTASGGANAGTSFRNQALWAVVPKPSQGGQVTTGWMNLLIGSN